jgi:hypothetical protein
MRIWYRGTIWDFWWRSESEEFSDHRSALAFHLRFKSDGQFMSGLRQLLAGRNPGYALSRVSDQQVLEEIAGLLASGQLQLKYEYRAVQEGTAPTEPEPAAQPGPEPPPPPKHYAPPEPEPEESVFPPDMDAAAMAGVLQQAAQSGKPFCEE